MEPFDEAEFWEQWVADAQARETERLRLEALAKAAEAAGGDPAADGGTGAAPPGATGGDPAAGLTAAAAGQGAVSAGAVAAVAVVAAGESAELCWWILCSMKYIYIQQ